MSLVRTVTFDAGADGVGLVAGDEGSLTVGGVVQYKTAAAVHGARGVRLVTGQADSISWTATGSGQASLYWTAMTIGTTTSVMFSLRTGTATFQMRFRTNATNGKFEITDDANTVIATSTASINATQDVRVDLRWVASGGNLTVTARLYLGANIEGSTPDETMSPAAYGITGTVDHFYLGSSAISWQYDFDTVRIYDDVVTWPVAFAGTVTPPSHIYSMSGNVGDDTASVVAKVTDTTLLKLRYSTHSDMSSPSTTASQTPDANGYARWDLTGLTADTKYYYRLTDTVSSVETAFGDTCSFRTLPAPTSTGTIKLAIGSCVFTNAPNAHDALLDIVAWDPHRFVHLGDAYYSGNASETLASGHRGRWETQIANVDDWQTLLQGCGLVYTNSDHELNPDNADSNTANGLSFNEFYRQTIPSFPLVVTGTNPVSKHQSWVDSNIRFILIDVKNHDRSVGTSADGSSKTMLGASQLAWLLSELSQPELLKVILCDVPWSRAAIVNSTNADKWWSYDHERTIIGNYIVDNGINVDFFHGDAHRLGVDETHNTWGGFPVSSCAPLSQTAGGSQTDGYWDQNWPLTSAGAANTSAYMRVTYQWLDADTLRRTCSGWDAVGDVERVSMVTDWVRPAAGPVNPFVKGAGSTVIAAQLFRRNSSGTAVPVTDITVAP